MLIGCAFVVRVRLVQVFSFVFLQVHYQSRHRMERARARSILQSSILVAVLTATVSLTFLSYYEWVDYRGWQKSETLLEKATPFLHSTGLRAIPVTSMAII